MGIGKGGRDKGGDDQVSGAVLFHLELFHYWPTVFKRSRTQRKGGMGKKKKRKKEEKKEGCSVLSLGEPDASRTS